MLALCARMLPQNAAPDAKASSTARKIAKRKTFRPTNSSVRDIQTSRKHPLRYHRTFREHCSSQKARRNRSGSGWTSTTAERSTKSPTMKTLNILMYTTYSQEARAPRKCTASATYTPSGIVSTIDRRDTWKSSSGTIFSRTDLRLVKASRQPPRALRTMVGGVQPSCWGTLPRSTHRM